MYNHFSQPTKYYRNFFQGFFDALFKRLKSTYLGKNFFSEESSPYFKHRKSR